MCKEIIFNLKISFTHLFVARKSQENINGYIQTHFAVFDHEQQTSGYCVMQLVTETQNELKCVCLSMC